jgi:N utilization substance protein B
MKTKSSGLLKSTRRPRSAARCLAVQALFNMSVTGASLGDTLKAFDAHKVSVQAFHEEDQLGKCEQKSRKKTKTSGDLDKAFYKELVTGVTENVATIARFVQEALKDTWSIDRLEQVLRVLLYAGTYELLYRPDVPVRVIISEYVELAQDFCAPEGMKLANGILDTIAHAARAQEMASPP